MKEFKTCKCGYYRSNKDCEIKDCHRYVVVERDRLQKQIIEKVEGIDDLTNLRKLLEYTNRF